MAAPPIPTTTPMMVFLVLVVMPLPDEDVPSAERTAVDVPVVTATDVDEETAVVRLPDTVIIVVYTTTLLDVDVYSDIEVIEEEVLVVFEEVEDVIGVLEGVEDGVELVCGVEDGVDEVVGVELTEDEVVCDCVASGFVPLLVLAETALLSF